MKLTDITPVLLTFNEADNLQRTLEGLKWAQQIIIVDSGSTDDTRRIAEAFPQVRWLTRAFDDFASQRNFGLDAVNTAWVLSLDADHHLSAELVSELASLDDQHCQAFFAAFKYQIWQQSVRCAILPARPVLFRNASCRYQPDGHAEHLMIDGRHGQLVHPVTHDDRKPLSRWVSAQDGYAQREAEKLRTAEVLGRADKIRRITWLAPLAVFFYVLIIRGGIFEGRRGFFYAYQRLLAEVNLALHLMQNEADSV
ncbi:MAG: glycosyltransferase family 2 protein [Lysobacterales bacterium]